MKSPLQPIACSLFFTLMILSVPRDSWAQTYVFKQGMNGYTGFQDVMLNSNFPSQSYGAELGVVNQNAVSIMKFENLNIPSGKYSFQLELACRSVVNSGTVNLWILKSLQWTDPHSNLNPPAPDSTNPSWTFRNYSSIHWESPGASGASERGAKIGEKWISTTGVYPYSGILEIINPKTAGFTITLANTGEIYFDSPDHSGDTNFPKLTLNLLVAYSPASLEGSTVFIPFRPLR